MFSYKYSDKLKKALKKLYKKDKGSYEKLIKKIQKIIYSKNIDHYKNLRYDLKEFKRIQIGEKVLVFKYDKEKKFISFDDYDNHDKIYK